MFFILIFIASFIAGYFTLVRLANEKANAQEKNNLGTVKAASLPVDNIVKSETDIIKKYTYSINKHRVYALCLLFNLYPRIRYQLYS
jgi:hypothetical protein